MKISHGLVGLLIPTISVASIDQYDVTPANIHQQSLPLKVEVTEGVESFESRQIRVVAVIGPGPAVDSLGAWTGILFIPKHASVAMAGHQDGDSLSWGFTIGLPVPAGSTFTVERVSTHMPSASLWRLRLNEFAPSRRNIFSGRLGMVLVGAAGLIAGGMLTALIGRRRVPSDSAV